MDFRVGDPVVHWTYGLGEIVGLEERALAGRKTLYYVVKIQNFNVYVPADGKAVDRLRPPTSVREFKNLFAILAEAGESLSEDRLERKTQLRRELADGKAETICRVIRDLSSFATKKQLNEDDKDILKRAWGTLCGEWGFTLSLPLAQVDMELRRLLAHPAESVAV
jgi:RNA polymerase-interacting CarD/CdnL/TRCF family regulator